MANPVQGSLGSLMIGTGEDEVAITKVTDWNVKNDKDTNTLGPWIGEPDEVVVEGAAKPTEIDFSCDVPIGGDDGQDAVVTAWHAKTHPKLTFTTTGGKAVEMVAPIYKSYELGVKAKSGETQSFKFGVIGVISEPTQDT